MRHTTLWLGAIVAASAGAARAQVDFEIPNMHTRLLIGSSAWNGQVIFYDGDEPLDLFHELRRPTDTQGSTVQGVVDAITYARGRNTFAAVDAQASTHQVGGALISCESFGEAGISLFGLIEATRSPPFALLPPGLVPLTLATKGSITVSGDLDVNNGGSFLSGGFGTVEVAVRDVDFSTMVYDAEAAVDTFHTNETTKTFAPPPIDVDLFVERQYLIGIKATARAVSPADEGNVQCHAQIDPILEFDQERFDDMARDQGFTPYKLSDYYRIAYSPNFPIPEPASAMLLAAAASCLRTSGRRRGTLKARPAVF